MNGICGRQCSCCNLFLACQGCSICEMPFCNQDCDRCFALCPRRSASFAHLKSVDGGLIRLQNNPWLQLPELIPILPDRMTDFDNGMIDVIGIHGGNFFTSNGEHVARVYRKKGLQGALNLSAPFEGVLQFYVKDRTLEGFWDNRQEIYQELLQFPWRAVIAPNFSVYEDAPRMDQLYNIKRSSIVYNEMLDAGLPAVPDVSWFNAVDLEQWVREICDRNVKTIAFSFQVVGTGSRKCNTYVHYAMGLHYLLERIPSDVHLILAGLASPKRLQLVLENCHQKFSVLNQSAYVHSRRGQLSETGKSAPVKMSKNNILHRNLLYYDGEYRRIQNAKT